MNDCETHQCCMSFQWRSQEFATWGVYTVGISLNELGGSDVEVFSDIISGVERRVNSPPPTFWLVGKCRKICLLVGKFSFKNAMFGAKNPFSVNLGAKLRKKYEYYTQSHLFEICSCLSQHIATRCLCHFVETENTSSAILTKKRMQLWSGGYIWPPKTYE